MIIHKPWLCTRMNIWAPRYSSKYDLQGEWVALLSKSTVHHASPVIIVDFTKAKHLKGQRFAIRRQEVEHCLEDSNGKIPCYAVPLGKFETWDSAAEIRDLALGAFDD